MVMNIKSILSGFGSAQNHVIEDLLNSENVTLEMLMENDLDFLQELKNRNASLIKFMGPSQISRVIEYIILDPDSDDHQRAHKYPFLCSQIISCENPELIDHFFNGIDLLDKLFSFLASETNNTILYGYFSKAVCVLLKRNPYELLSYIHDHAKIGTKLPHFLYSASIMELLLKLMGSEDHGNPAYEADLFEMTASILQNLSIYHPEEVKNNMRIINSGNLLVELLTCHIEDFNWSSILFQLNCPTEIEILLAASLGINEIVSSTVNSIILAMLQNIDNEQTEDNIISDEIPMLIERIAECIGKFKEILLQDFPVFGLHRLQLVRIVSKVIKLNYQLTTNAIKEENVISVIVVRDK